MTTFGDLTFFLVIWSGRMNYVRARTGRARSAMHIKTIRGDLEKSRSWKTMILGDPGLRTWGARPKSPKMTKTAWYKFSRAHSSCQIQKCKRKHYRSNSRKVTTFRRTLVGVRWHVARVVWAGRLLPGWTYSVGNGRKSRSRVHRTRK